MKLILLTLISLFSLPALSADAPIISIMETEGKVTLASKDGKIHWGDKISGEPGSKLRARISYQSWVLIGPFKASFEKSDAEGKVIGLLRLEEGQSRIQIQIGSQAHAVPTVRTPSAVMGVRGTDFFASYNPLLGESEIISFENDIEFQSVQTSSHVVVHTGQWGGIGGRFGNTIQPPMQLPENVIKHFKDKFIK
mgnify:FL=1